MEAEHTLAPFREGKRYLPRCELKLIGRFVETMLRDQLPHLVVPVTAVRAWQEREPQTWAMVCDWLAAQGKSVVQV